jgi:DNA-binding NtrC family response regulator
MGNQGRVLVVEDHEGERRALSTLLKAEGFTVFGAENADKALGYIDENVDVVLSDLHMGDVSGLDLLQLWKKRQPDTQFILVTGERAPSNIVDAMRNGAYDYVTKPINTEELVPARSALRPGSNHRFEQADEGCFRQDPAGRSGR